MYDQPMFIPDKPHLRRLRERYGRYLPALEEPETTPEEHREGKPVYRDEVNQLKGLLTHLHNEVHTLMEEKEAPVKPKRKSKY